jgi:hypothetical protein
MPLIQSALNLSDHARHHNRRGAGGTAHAR